MLLNPDKRPSVPRFEVDREYPRDIVAGEWDLRLRPMVPTDATAMLEFARALPEDDLLFLQSDITQSEVVEEWLSLIEAGRVFTALLECSGEIAGYGSLSRQRVLWTRHLAEIRMNVSPRFRGGGLGGVLGVEILDVAKGAGLRRIVAQMPRDQAGARTVFRKLGFNLESMLADWVIDLEGNTHDLVIMAYYVGT